MFTSSKADKYSDWPLYCTRSLEEHSHWKQLVFHYLSWHHKLHEKIKRLLCFSFLVHWIEFNRVMSVPSNSALAEFVSILSLKTSGSKESLMLLLSYWKILYQRDENQRGDRGIEMNRDQKEEKYKRIIWRRSNCIIAWWWRHHFISRSSFSFNRRIELHRFVYLFEIEEFDWKERMYTIIMNIFVDCTTNCYIILIIQIVQNLFGFGMELKKS